jgi:hypothetical protein
MVTYNLPPEPLWRRKLSAVAVWLPRPWTQGFQQRRARVAVLLFATIMVGACTLLLVAVARVAWGATGR